GLLACDQVIDYTFHHNNIASSLPFEHLNKQFARLGNADLNLILFQKERATRMAWRHRARACSIRSASVSSLTAARTMARSISMRRSTRCSSVTIRSSTSPPACSTSASSRARSATISPVFASSSAVPNRPRAISPSSFSRKSAISHPLGFSILISLVRFHPISKLGGSGLCRPDCRPGSRRIADFRRFSISKEVVMAAGGRSGNSSDWLASRVGFESEAGSGFPMEGEEEVQRGPRNGVAGSFWREGWG
ncbi:unnamed protein product, partial [Musa banksii]